MTEINVFVQPTRIVIVIVALVVVVGLWNRWHRVVCGWRWLNCAEWRSLYWLSPQRTANKPLH